MKAVAFRDTQEEPVDRSTYGGLCEQYGPLLWGIILLANLPISYSEPILVRTLAKAWQQRHRHPVGGPCYLSWLIGLAHQEGLPFERVQAILQTVLDQPI